MVVCRSNERLTVDTNRALFVVVRGDEEKASTGLVDRASNDINLCIEHMICMYKLKFKVVDSDTMKPDMIDPTFNAFVG